MSSYSTDESTAMGFSMMFEETDKGVVFVSKSKNGVSIKNISSVPREDEVLVPKGVKFKMIKEPYEKDGRTYIEVEEV